MFAEIFNNLHEDSEEEHKQLESAETNSLKEFYNVLGYKQGQHYHMKWDIAEEEIESEMDRQQVSALSFIFIFKWFNFQNRQKSKENSYLLSQMQ